MQLCPCLLCTVGQAADAFSSGVQQACSARAEHTSTLGTSTPDLHTCSRLSQTAESETCTSRSRNKVSPLHALGILVHKVLVVLVLRLERPARMLMFSQADKHTTVSSARRGGSPVHNELPARAGKVLQVQHAVVLVARLACGPALIVHRHHVSLIVLLDLQHSPNIRLADFRFRDSALRQCCFACKL